jgi:tetratricopeptide (TPR) repeat protein
MAEKRNGEASDEARPEAPGLGPPVGEPTPASNPTVVLQKVWKFLAHPVANQAVRVIAWILVFVLGVVTLVVEVRSFEQGRRANEIAEEERAESEAERVRKSWEQRALLEREALAGLERAWEGLNPTPGKGSLRLGVCLRERVKEAHDAIAAARRDAWFSREVQLEILRVRAGARLVCRHLGEAEREFAMLLEIAPEDANGQHNLGITLAEEGRLAEAEERVREALALLLADPGQHGAGSANALEVAEVRANLGEILVSQAEDLLRQGATVAAQERFEEAIAELRGALGADQELGLAHLYLAVALNNLADPPVEEILDELRLAIAHLPEESADLADAHYSLGAVLFDDADSDRVRLDGAIASFGKTLALAPDHSDAARDLSKALLRAGRCEEAIEHFDRALKLAPRDQRADLYAHLGAALLELGREVDALEQCRHFLALKPSARCTLEELEGWLDAIMEWRPPGVASCGAVHRAAG